MRINLQTSFAVEGFDTAEIDLPDVVSTVSDLLACMGRKTDTAFIDPTTGETEFDLEIHLNGKEIWFHPMGLNTPLQPGDDVEIYPLPLGGG